MKYEPIARDPDSFQQPVTEDEVLAMCRRAFGPQAEPESAVELGIGLYNNTFRVQFGDARPVVLRVAPPPERQLRMEPELMRNEHATVPYLAPIAHLMPRTLAVDFTHTVIGRDFLFQTHLDGVPAPQGLRSYPRAHWRTFFRQLGSIAREIHSVRGTGYGRVAGPLHGTWSDALLAWFDAAAADLTDAGLDCSDVHRLAELVDRHRAVMDDIDGPRLLHGDLWNQNIMVADGAPEPTITGVCDGDRAWWGDPASDWPIFMALRRPGSERDALWDGYGQLRSDPEATWRSLVYRARHTVALRSEYAHNGKPEQAGATYDEVRSLLSEARAVERA